ncbi:hypothetical protein MMC07_002713 [Pseudocyphellaria aurata]|nr:hypothetical protein [Pseudocyphellaria aurata]
MCIWNRFVYDCGHPMWYLELEEECNAAGKRQIVAYEKNVGFPHGLECPPGRRTTYSKHLPGLCTACLWYDEHRQSLEADRGVEEEKHYQEEGHAEDAQVEEKRDHAEESPMNEDAQVEEKRDHAEESPMNEDAQVEEKWDQAEESPMNEDAQVGEKWDHAEESPMDEREYEYPEVPQHPDEWFDSKETLRLKRAASAAMASYLEEGPQQEETSPILKNALCGEHASDHSHESPHDQNRWYSTDETAGLDGARGAPKAPYFKGESQEACWMPKNTQSEEGAPGDIDEFSTNVQEPFTGEKDQETIWTYLGCTGSYT